MVRFVFNTLCVLLSCTSVYALPVGNPVDATLYRNGVCTGPTRSDPCVIVFNYTDILRLRGGFYSDTVFNRHMEVYLDRKNISDIDVFSLATNAGYLAVNIFDWVDFFCTLGATNIGMVTDGASYSTNSTLIALDFDTHFSWSVGMDLTVWKRGGLGVGFEAQYFKTKPPLDSILRFASGNSNYFNEDNHLSYDEWQVGLGVAYEYKNAWLSATPYIAIKRARGEMGFDDFAFAFEGVDYTLHNLRSKKLWGHAVGVSAVLCEMIGITVEGRFADEKAVSVNGQFRY
ncbi:MAG: Major outer membrane porin [Chlamydiales bacterium]|nr:Major outer membrane porin [Chlamydiales bacterium]MCH9620300.1 Major outer membrane porin [Chlamydiales bacterium]MCH9622789.1 Major outer membrane porin [Chlamydiales bacterium]